MPNVPMTQFLRKTKSLDPALLMSGRLEHTVAMEMKLGLLRNGRPGIVAGGKKIVHLADIDEDEMTMEKMMSLLFLILNGISTSSKRLKCYPIQVRPIIKLAK